MTLDEAMRTLGPELFIHSGDRIYADGPIRAEVRLDDGTRWKNVVTEEKSKVAETLRAVRGNFACKLLPARGVHAGRAQLSRPELTESSGGAR